MLTHVLSLSNVHLTVIPPVYKKYVLLPLTQKGWGLLVTFFFDCGSFCQAEVEHHFVADHLLVFYVLDPMVYVPNMLEEDVYEPVGGLFDERVLQD